jgi:hypothetical protein
LTGSGAGNSEKGASYGGEGGSNTGTTYGSATIAQDLESDFISRIDLTFMWNEVNDKLRGSSYNVSVELSWS